MNKTIFKNVVFLYLLLYTVATILNSIIYLAQGVRDDPSGNWHEIDRAIIVFIIVLAFELCCHLKVNPSWLRYIIAYVPSQLSAFGYVWLAGHRGEDLAASAYRDIWINFTAGYIVICIISLLINVIQKKNRRQNSTGSQ